MKKEFDIIDLDFTDALPVVKEEETKEKYYSTEETISEENYEAEENTAGANVNANAEELTINESGFRENRVRPLGQTLVSLPVSTKARRSAFRETRAPVSSRISRS